MNTIDKILVIAGAVSLLIYLSYRGTPEEGWSVTLLFTIALLATIHRLRQSQARIGSLELILGRRRPEPERASTDYWWTSIINPWYSRQYGIDLNHLGYSPQNGGVIHDANIYYCEVNPPWHLGRHLWRGIVVVDTEHETVVGHYQHETALSFNQSLYERLQRGDFNTRGVRGLVLDPSRLGELGQAAAVASLLKPEKQ